MKVLLTNDDGVDAEGLCRVRRALMEVADRVVTVAPMSDRSGLAQACTFSRPVMVRRVEPGPHPIYSCDGTPTDCVRVGLLGGLAPSVNLVVSGINHGANLADDVAYSGTIGAGREAAILGTSALCLSQQTPTGSFAVNYQEIRGAYDFTSAANFGALLALSIASAAPSQPVLLSANFPSRVASNEAVLTRIGRRAYPRANAATGPDGQEDQQLWLFGAPGEEIPYDESAVDTDIAALRSGRISVTPLP
ncbi:MAG: 5'/3'-nucleotidase SurE, partial [Acidimicrobiales bacterium]